MSAETDNGLRPPAQPPQEATFVFSARARGGFSATAVAVGLVLVVAATAVPEGTDWYLAALIVAAAPFATPGLWFAWRVLHEALEVYRPFWQRWLAAAGTAYAAGAAALVGVATPARGALGVAVALLVAAVPLWASAGLHMLRAQAGRRAVSVDVLDATTAVVVLGTPAVLLLAEPLAATDHPLWALPFVASAVLMPGGLYLSLVSLRRVPRGERATQGIAMALGAAFSLNAAVQLAQVLSDFALPLPAIVLCQVLNMGLLMAVPLWAHRTTTSWLHDLLPEEQVRRTDPLAVITAVLLPALAGLAWWRREHEPWGVPLVLTVLTLVVVLGAVRNALLRRETTRLYAELERVADDRRRLLTRLVGALEDDRRRMASELHVQAVESFAALGALVQTAYITLPPDAARSVKEAIAHVQDDLSRRADALRQLAAAVRPPTFGADDADVDDRTDSLTVVSEGMLATALQAVASQEVGERSATHVSIAVDPALELDWSTTTIVYRIAQEAVANAARHAAARTIAVSVHELDAQVVVEVVDDGRGFVPAVAAGPGTDRMRLFAELGGGHVELHSEPGSGTTVRAVLGALASGTPSPPGPASERGRHLVLLAGQAEAEEDLGAPRPRQPLGR